MTEAVFSTFLVQIYVSKIIARVVFGGMAAVHFLAQSLVHVLFWSQQTIRPSGISMTLGS